MNAKEFKRLILPLSGKLLRFAQHFLNNKELAEDTVQDVFVRLWKKRDVIEKLDSVEAYAMRIARNICIDKSKERRRFLFKNSDEYTYLSDKDIGVDEQMENAESVFFVKRVIKSLPEQQRMVIYLRDVEHYEFEEISDVLKIKNGAVRANLSRARKKVRDEVVRIENGKLRIEN
jgi:RNA polymerase sigma-70 factor (ECF subfamily)